MKKNLLIVLAALSAIIVEAQQLRDGHFFKTFTDAQQTALAAPEVFSQWFTLPEGTEWRETRRQTDNLGMEHVDYRQYVGGVEVEHAIVKLHFKDGMLRSANGNVMEARRSPAKLRRAPMVYKNGTPVDELGRKLLLVYTNEGYRYATKMLSTDHNYWIYIDAESGKELQRIPTRYCAEPEKATVTGSTIYSGEVQMDASFDSDKGVYYLYDKDRNIHTMIAAYLPSYLQMIADKTLYLNFPEFEACNIPIEELTFEKLEEWVSKGFQGKDLHPFNYLNRNGIYAYSSTPMFDSYRFKSFTIDRLSASTNSGMVDLHPNEFLPLHLKVAISCLNSEGMIEFQQQNITKLPYTIDMTMTNDEIPVVGVTISIYSKSLGDDGREDVKLLTSIELKPDESGVCTWDNDFVKASALYEKSPWSAADIHWGMARTYDFYKEKFNQNSYDDNGSPIYNLFYLPLTNWTQEPYIAQTDMNNAAAIMGYGDMFMVYGMGGLYAQKSVMRPVVELSIMAHEFTHMVTNVTPGLVYQGESGALNESISDIMGISVKKYVEGDDASWLIAENVFPYYSCLRSMASPKESKDGDQPCPDTYGGEHWVDPNNIAYDHGGVHINSGVQNKWFYLLSDGGTGTNDKNFTYDVTGIGIDKAQQIVYRTTMKYATSQSQYADMRLASLQAAEDLHGAESAELASVLSAWDAVGVTEGSATGIEMVKNPQSVVNGQAGKWYTLDGRLLDGQPTKKGMYIHNGNKIVVK
jgi:Zn-dependent metalloprotease